MRKIAQRRYAFGGFASLWPCTHSKGCPGIPGQGMLTCFIGAVIVGNQVQETITYPSKSGQLVLDLLQKWYPEDDPIIKNQIATLLSLLGGVVTESAMEGFLIVCSRFVDEYGNHRTEELADIFRTHKPEGKRALLGSLEYMNRWVGGMQAYERLYPVTIIPPRPAFPQFKIIGIGGLASRLYRVLDSTGKVYGTNETVSEFISRTGRLPAVPVQRRPVRRSKPRFHWCSYEKWDDPDATREALQILPTWSDCKLRATILTSKMGCSAYVAFNGDREDPGNKKLRFYKYFYEPLAQDHPPQSGGGPQIALDGQPIVECLERWNTSSRHWEYIWSRHEGEKN